MQKICCVEVSKTQSLDFVCYIRIEDLCSIQKVTHLRYIFCISVGTFSMYFDVEVTLYIFCCLLITLSPINSVVVLSISYASSFITYLYFRLLPYIVDLKQNYLLCVFISLFGSILHQILFSSLGILNLKTYMLLFLYDLKALTLVILVMKPHHSFTITTGNKNFTSVTNQQHRPTTT